MTERALTGRTLAVCALTECALTSPPGTLTGRALASPTAGPGVGAPLRDPWLLQSWSRRGAPTTRSR